jgi:hypothetical protein
MARVQVKLKVWVPDLEVPMEWVRLRIWAPWSESVPDPGMLEAG